MRRKSKNKLRPNKAETKGIEEEKAETGPPAASAASEAPAGSARPSSTTSRDSENDVVTSGYFRLTARVMRTLLSKTNNMARGCLNHNCGCTTCDHVYIWGAAEYGER